MIDLQSALEYGIIDEASLCREINMAKREERIKAHPHKIWRGANGRWYTYFDDPERGLVQKCRKEKEALLDDISSWYEIQAENPTVGEVFNRWNDGRLKMGQIAPGTAARNRSVFKRYFDNFRDKRVRQILISAWCDFLEEQIAGEALNPKQASLLKGVVRGIISRARRERFVSYTPDDVFAEWDTYGIRYAKRKDPGSEVYTDEEVAALENVFKERQGVKDLILLLMFATGIRVGEAVALRNEDMGQSSIHIHATEVKYCLDGKTYVEVKDSPKTDAGVRTVILPKSDEWILKKIRLINPFGEFAFVRENGNRVRAEKVRKHLERTCKELNIPYRSPHKIRKTYVSILLDNNLDKRLILDQVGHTDIGTSERYYHRTRRDDLEKQRILDSVKGL